MDIKLTTELIKRRKGGKIESCYSIIQSSFHYFFLVNCTLEATALSLCTGVKGIKVEKFSLDWRSNQSDRKCPETISCVGRTRSYCVLFQCVCKRLKLSEEWRELVHCQTEKLLLLMKRLCSLKETFSGIEHAILKKRLWMLHLETTGVRWSGFTKSKWLGVKIDKVYELVLNTKSCLKIKSKTILQLSRAGCRHSADGEESWRRGCAVSITCQGICPCPAQLAWPASACPRTSQSSLPTAPNQESAALCYPTFLLPVWIWSCRELGRIFRSVEIIAPRQDKNPGREELRTLWCRGTGMVRAPLRALSISAVLPVSNTGSSPLTAE